MVCTTVTISEPSLIISNLVAIPREDQIGWVDITWTQNVAGNITGTRDGVVIFQSGWPSGNNATVISGLATGIHTICIEPT